jgi:hypothetical protein
MNKLDIAGNKLSVQRVPASSAAVLLQPSVQPASSAQTAAAAAAAAAIKVTMSAPPPPPAAAAAVAENPLAKHPQSAVIRMSNMTSQEDLDDDALYEELIEDISDECNSHGTVKSIVIPRGDLTRAASAAPEEAAAAVGKIFVHFVSSVDAAAALRAVAGRKFNGRVVEAYFYPEELFLGKVHIQLLYVIFSFLFVVALFVTL